MWKNLNLDGRELERWKDRKNITEKYEDISEKPLILLNITEKVSLIITGRLGIISEKVKGVRGSRKECKDTSCNVMGICQYNEESIENVLRLAVTWSQIKFSQSTTLTIAFFLDCKTWGSQIDFLNWNWEGCCFCLFCLTVYQPFSGHLTPN